MIVWSPSPLMRSVAKKVTVLYDLMDAGYSANAIRKASRELEHAPIIDPNPTTHDTPPLDPLRWSGTRPNNG